LEWSGQQYLYIIEGSHPIDPAGIDHLGIIVESRDEVDDIQERCRAIKKNDDRLWLDDAWAGVQQSVVPYDPENDPSFNLKWDNGWVPPYVVYAFNFSYLLPVGWDVQYETYKPGKVPDKVWQFA